MNTYLHLLLQLLLHSTHVASKLNHHDAAHLFHHQIRNRLDAGEVPLRIDEFTTSQFTLDILSVYHRSSQETTLLDYAYDSGDNVDGITIQDGIGEGTFGEAYLAEETNRITGETRKVVLKYIKDWLKLVSPARRQDRRSYEDYLKSIEKEKNMLKLVKDIPHVSQYLRTVKARSRSLVTQIRNLGYPLTRWYRPEHVFFVMKYYELGELGHALSNFPKEWTAEERARITLKLIHHVSEGLALIHNKKIIHRDIKPANILVGGEPHNPDTWEAYVADFGLSVLCVSQFNGRCLDRDSVAGTPDYIAPERVASLPIESMDM